MNLYEDKIKAKILKNIKKVDNCWIWQKFITYKGYGESNWYGKTIMAHRLSYILFVGDIPKGLTIDHLCRNRACINPEHLEAVTNKENTLRGIGITAINARKTHCIHGHEFTPENTLKNGTGRNCRACGRKANIKYKKSIRHHV